MVQRYDVSRNVDWNPCWKKPKQKQFRNPTRGPTFLVCIRMIGLDGWISSKPQEPPGPQINRWRLLWGISETWGTGEGRNGESANLWITKWSMRSRRESSHLRIIWETKQSFKYHMCWNEILAFRTPFVFFNDILPFTIILYFCFDMDPPQHGGLTPDHLRLAD